MSSFVRLSAALAIAVAVAVPAGAAPFYTNSPLVFTGLATAPFVIESFEGTPTGDTFGLTFGSTTITSVSGTLYQDNTYPSDGIYSVTSESPDVPTFHFAAPVTAFGIDVLDLGTNGITSLYMRTDANTFVTVIGNYQTMLRSLALFVGVIDPADFSSVTLNGSAPNDVINFDYQRTIAYFPPSPVGGVPEPTTWSLLIAGLGAVGAAVRGRRATAVTA